MPNIFHALASAPYISHVISCHSSYHVAPLISRLLNLNHVPLAPDAVPTQYLDALCTLVSGHWSVLRGWWIKSCVLDLVSYPGRRSLSLQTREWRNVTVHYLTTAMIGQSMQLTRKIVD